ncbi:MAG: hypothetical protein KGY41_02905 [Desulfovermiculus sp.]|nr:hypothetical protein [Desulfovermiculus sp.]
MQDLRDKMKFQLTTDLDGWLRFKAEKKLRKNGCQMLASQDKISEQGQQERSVDRG